jgi:hypothetical protein
MPYVNYKKQTPWTAEQIAYMLATDDAWLERAIVALHDRQIELEKMTRTTYVKNEVGLQVADAILFSKFAEKIKSGKHLSETEKKMARRPWSRPKTPIPTICKYRHQVLQMIEAAARKAKRGEL